VNPGREFCAPALVAHTGERLWKPRNASQNSYGRMAIRPPITAIDVSVLPYAPTSNNIFTGIIMDQLQQIIEQGLNARCRHQTAQCRWRNSRRRRCRHRPLTRASCASRKRSTAMGDAPVAEEGRAAGRSAWKNNSFVQGWFHQLLRPRPSKFADTTAAISAKRLPRGCAGGGAQRRIHRKERGADAVLCEHRALSTRARWWTPGNGRLVCADRQGTYT